MKICVFGAGVIGSLYAGKLASAGHEVTVVARGNRLVNIENNGILLEDEFRSLAVALSAVYGALQRLSEMAAR